MTGIDTSSFAKKVDFASLKSDADILDIDKVKYLLTNLSNLKSKVDKLDADKLSPIAVDLSKLSDIVQNDVVKKDEDKITDITNQVTKTPLHAKINEVKEEIPNITNLTTKAALNDVENKRPSVSNLVKKLNITQKLMKLKRKLLIIIMINILLLQNLISYHQKILLQD